jgi:hypothetical protein
VFTVLSEVEYNSCAYHAPKQAVLRQSLSTKKSGTGKIKDAFLILVDCINKTYRVFYYGLVTF